MAECYLYGQNAAGGESQLESNNSKHYRISTFPYNQTFSDNSPIRYISFGASGGYRMDCFIDINAKRYFIPVYNSSDGSNSYKYFSSAIDIENIYEFSIILDATLNFTFSSDFKQMTINVSSSPRTIYFSYFA